MSNSATPWTAARQASVSFTISQGLLKLMSIESVMPSSHFILCYPLLLLPSVFPSIRVFPVSQLFVLGGWSIGASALVLFFFFFSVSPYGEYSGLISFKIDWFDLLAVQGTPKFSPAPQLESINSSVLSLLYGPTLTSIHDYWKNHSFHYMDLLAEWYLCFLILSLGLS